MKRSRMLYIVVIFLLLDVTKVVCVLVSESKAIGSCNQRIDSEGVFIISGRVRPRRHQFPPYCSMKIRSPYGTRIKVDIAVTENYECSDTTYLAVFDGWQITDPLRRTTSFIPESADFIVRSSILCIDREGRPTFSELKSSQNYVEIAFRLSVNQKVELRVEFEKSNENCDQLLYNEDFEKPLVLQSSSSQETCRLYLPGMISLVVSNIQSSKGSSSCTNCVSNYVKAYGGTNVVNQEELMTMGSKGKMPQTISIACYHSSLEIRSTGEQKVEVEFSFRSLSMEQRVFSQYRCS